MRLEHRHKKWHNSAPKVYKSMYISCAFSCLEVAYQSGWRILMSFHTELSLQRDAMGKFWSINVLLAQKQYVNMCVQNSLPPLFVYRQGFCWPSADMFIYYTSILITNGSQILSLYKSYKLDDVLWACALSMFSLRILIVLILGENYPATRWATFTKPGQFWELMIWLTQLSSLSTGSSWLSSVTHIPHHVESEDSAPICSVLCWTTPKEIFKTTYIFIDNCPPPPLHGLICSCGGGEHSLSAGSPTAGSTTLRFLDGGCQRDHRTELFWMKAGKLNFFPICWMRL